MAPIVAYDQLWLPSGLTPDAGKDEEVTDEMLRGKLAFAKEQHLGLELYLTDRVRRFYDANEYGGTPLVTLQAFAMHRWFPLAASLADRAAGVTYVQETLEAAGAFGVPRIVTACAFKTDETPL